MRSVGDMMTTGGVLMTQHVLAMCQDNNLG